MLYLFLFQARLVRDKVRRKEKKDGKDRRVGGGKEEEEMDRRTTYFLRPARPLRTRWGLAWVSKRGKTSQAVVFRGLSLYTKP